MKIFQSRKKDEKKEEIKEPTKTTGAVRSSKTVLLNVLNRPWLSEKATLAKQQNKYSFLVQPKANKKMIKEEIQKRYQVKVTAVNIVKKQGKPKRFGRKIGRTPMVKKAVVTLTTGQSLDIG